MSVPSDLIVIGLVSILIFILLGRPSKGRRAS